MKKRSTLIIVLFIATLLFSGCNNGEQTMLQQIEESGEMTFAMTGGYPPFNFINEQGELDGFDIEIAEALAEELGVQAVPITTAWDGIIGGLLSKRFDTIIGSMAITEERLQKVSFTDPYYYDGAQLFGMSDTKITSLSQMEAGKIGVVTGTTYHDALKDIENIGEIMQFESDVDNMMALEQNRIDGLVTGRFVGLQAPERYGLDLVPIGEMLYAEKIGIAVRKEDKAFLAALNEALATIVENGTYDAISKKWFQTNILERE